MGSDLTYDINTPDGWAELTRHSPGSHVASLRIHVFTEAQRHGVGRELIRRAVWVARKQGIKRIEATPYTDNPGATSFFAALPGWYHEGIRAAGGRRGRRIVDTHLFAWVDGPAAIALRGCPSPGCPNLMYVDEETRVWRCPMHGPMGFADQAIERLASVVAASS